MLMRWAIRAIASAVGLVALLGAAYALKAFALKDPARERFKEGVAASAAIRQELGRDCSLTVDLVPGSDELVMVTVKYDEPPPDRALRKELVRNTNIVVRRFVHHIKALEIRFRDEEEPIPSWDGGVAVAGTPEPAGVNAPKPPPSTPEPARIGVAPVEPPGGGTKKAAPKPAKTGTVTLVTFPEADVFKGKEKLGHTPMFNAELPVGTHLLTLVGGDGARHRLSLPVKQGKNAPLKMNLADLPAR